MPRDVSQVAETQHGEMLIADVENEFVLLLVVVENRGLPIFLQAFAWHWSFMKRISQIGGPISERTSQIQRYAKNQLDSVCVLTQL